MQALVQLNMTPFLKNVKRQIICHLYFRGLFHQTRKQLKANLHTFEVYLEVLVLSLTVILTLVHVIKTVILYSY